MNTKLLPIRRWGVAVLAGVTLLGTVAVLGEGVASAAVTTTVASTGTTVVAPASTNTAIANVTLTENTAGAIPAGDVVCLVPSQGAFQFGGVGAAYTLPTVTNTGGAVVAAQTAGTNPGTPPAFTSATYSAQGETDPNPATVNVGDYIFSVTTASSTAATYTIAGLYVTDNGTAFHGQVTLSVGIGTTLAAACGVSPSTAATGLLNKTPVIFGGVQSAPAIYGTTSDQTTAAAFESLGCTSSTSKAAVLATDADPFDALAAASLEKELSTGLLITEPTAIDPATAQAMALEGVNTVYVVGGSSAVSAADIATLKATNATQCGDVATGSTISVKGPFSGATADDTAAAIANEVQTLTTPYASASPQFPSTAGIASTSFNDVSANSAGNGTAGSAQGAGHLAIVVSDAEAQDAASVSSLAYHYEVPILLTNPSTLSTQVSTEIATLGTTQVIVIGGPLAVAPAVAVSLEGLSGVVGVLRIAGQDASDTSSELAAFLTNSAGLNLNATTTKVFLTQSTVVTDALGGAAVANGQPIILTEAPATGLGSAATAELANLSNVNVVTPFGGPLAVSSTTISAALTALAS